MRSSCSPARRRHTGRRDDSAVVYPRRFASLVKFEHTVFALPFAYVGAFLARRRGAERARPALDHPGHGRSALARDGAQPADRRRHRRAQPAHGRRASCRRGRCVRGRSSSSAPSRWRSSCSPSSSSTRSSAGCGRSRWRCSSSTRTSSASRGSAMSGSAQSRARARRRLGGDHGRAAARGLAARRRGRSLGRRLRPLLRDLRHRDRPRAGPAFVPGALRRRRGVLGRARAARRDRRLLLAWAGARPRRRRLLLARRGRRRGAARVRARDRVAGRPATPQHGVLHAERRDQHRRSSCFVLADVAT